MCESTLDIVGRLTFSQEPLGGFEDFNELHKALVFFQRSHFDQYVPTTGSGYPDYRSRLEAWLNNVASDAERALLLELAARIVFFAREDISKLNEAALRGPINQWIIKKENLVLTDPNFATKLRTEVHNHTWYTSITDSMPISDFHHINHIGGVEHRPDWKSLAKLGNSTEISNFMQQHHVQGRPSPLNKIVILEDFVGSGTQMQDGEGSVDFAARTFPSIPILVCPLICCPEGAREGQALENRYTNLSFEPVIELSEVDLLIHSTNYDHGTFENLLQDFCNSSWLQVRGDDSAYPRPYHPFGFAETGAMVVMYTNTPANTLPIVQHESNQWRALFPRSARVK